MRHIVQSFYCLFLALVLLGAPTCAPAAEPASGTGTSTLTSAQLDQLTAPIALYPDSLLAQILMAATYPLDVVSAARWSKANPNVKGKDLDAAMQAQAWDPSVKSLTAFPQVLDMMSDKLDWTQQLGNAFLAQSKDVMDSVQRLRASAQAQGALKSNQQQTVTVTKEPSSSTSVIVIQPSQPDVVYVPAYNPTVVYGAWPYPSYPPYAWYPPGYAVAGAVVSFGLGVATGYALWGEPDWHHGDVNINVNNYTRFNGGPPPPPHGGWNGGGPRPGGPGGPGYHGGGTQWQHDPAHRGNVPYAGQTGDRFRTPGGVSRDQERTNAREAFRGRTGITPGGDQAARNLGRGPAQAQTPAQRLGQGPRQESRPNLGQEQRRIGQGQSSERREGLARSPERTQHRNMPSGLNDGRIERGSGGGNMGLFQHSGGQSVQREFSRGSQSRRIMSSHPGGGGFHGGGHQFRR